VLSLPLGPASQRNLAQWHRTCRDLRGRL